MKSTHHTIKEPLLLLSLVVPDAHGSPAAARAWQTLCQAAQTHDVDLACLVDRPVQLNHWRALQAQTARIAMQPQPFMGHLVDSLSARGRGGKVTRSARALLAAISPWLSAQRYQAAMYMHPELKAMAERIEPAMRALSDVGAVTWQPTGTVAQAA